MNRNRVVTSGRLATLTGLPLVQVRALMRRLKYQGRVRSEGRDRWTLPTEAYDRLFAQAVNAESGPKVGTGVKGRAST